MADSNPPKGEIQLQLELLEVLSTADLEKVEADPQLRRLKDETVLWEKEALKTLGDIRDADAKARMKIRSLEEAIKLAKEKAAQKQEEATLKQEEATQTQQEAELETEVVRQMEEELKAILITEDARKHFGQLQYSAVYYEQLTCSGRAWNRISDALDPI